MQSRNAKSAWVKSIVNHVSIANGGCCSVDEGIAFAVGANVGAKIRSKFKHAIIACCSLAALSEWEKVLKSLLYLENYLLNMVRDALS